MQKVLKKGTTILLAGIMCAVMAACGSSSAAGGTHGHPLTHLTLWLDYSPWGAHVPIFAAQQEGYFKAQGLAVSIKQPADVSDPLKLVAENGDTLGIGYMSDVVTAESQGIPVESVAALVQHQLNCIMTLKSSGITSPRQLKGKRIGDDGTPADTVILDTVFKAAGVLGKVQRVNDGFSPVPFLLSGRVDAIEGAYQVWERIKIEQHGKQVNVIQLRHWGVPDEYELVLLAGRQMVHADPAVIAAFMRALTHGVQFSVRHPSHAVADFLKINPSNAAGQALVRRSWSLLVPFVQPPGTRFGIQRAYRWHGLATWMHRTRLVPKLVPNQVLFTNRFLPG